MTPHFFYISDIANSSAFNGKIFRKKSMLEKFRANVLKDFYCKVKKDRHIKELDFSAQSVQSIPRFFRILRDLRFSRIL